MIGPPIPSQFRKWVRPFLSWNRAEQSRAESSWLPLPFFWFRSHLLLLLVVLGVHAPSNLRLLDYSLHLPSHPSLFLSSHLIEILLYYLFFTLYIFFRQIPFNRNFNGMTISLYFLFFAIFSFEVNSWVLNHISVVHFLSLYK